MIQVLIVGAGPVGLFLAAELARHGVIARVVDKRTRSEHSKAIALHPRTLELLADCGGLEAALARGRKVSGVQLYGGGRPLIHVDLDDVDSEHRHILILPQSDTEEILEALCVERGVIVERGVTCTSVSQDVDGCEVALARPLPDDAEEASVVRVRAEWVVACDGADSTVRRALGLPFQGDAVETPIAVMDAPLRVNLADDTLHAFFTADGVAAFVPLPEQGLWRVVCNVPQGAQAPYTAAGFQKLLAERIHLGFELGEPRWIAELPFRRRKVEQYRDGRVFLAGDAAHCHSPIGGQGMNAGIQDAYNLAWKLALVAQGVGRTELLDSYGAEREPVARDLQAETVWATRAAGLHSAIPQRLRDAILGVAGQFETVRTKLADNAGQLEIHYRDSPIVAEINSSLLATILTATPDDEIPSVADWTDFSRAPRAGDRAPDVQLGHGTLHELLYGTRHTLLLFDGAAPTPSGYETMRSIARQVRERYGRYVAAHVVVPDALAPPALEGESVILDPHSTLHARYGAGAECLYVIRPDGHVGYRSQPADPKGLMDWLVRTFV